MLGVHGFPNLILLEKKIIYQDNIYVTNIKKNQNSWSPKLWDPYADIRRPK